MPTPKKQDFDSSKSACKDLKGELASEDLLDRLLTNLQKKIIILRSFFAKTCFMIKEQLFKKDSSKQILTS